MKRFTRTMALLFCLFLAVPAFAETVRDDRPDYFAPADFMQMYNEAAEAFVDNYYNGKDEEGKAQIKKDCLFTDEDAEGQFLYLNSATGAVKAAFLFEDGDFTEKDPSILWNFYISRYLPSESISLSAYTLMSMIGYAYRDTVPMEDLKEWFQKLADPDDGFELPGYTLSMLVTEEYIQYMMLPPADKNPLLKNQETTESLSAVQEEIRFLNLPWGCDIETAHELMGAAGLLTEAAESRFKMAQRVLDRGEPAMRETSYNAFRKTEEGITADSDDQAMNVIELHLMSDMVNPYLGREVHNIALLFLVEDGTQKLLNVRVSYMISDTDVLPVLAETYGEPQEASDSEDEDYGKIWFGENGTALLWTESALNYGLLNAEELVHGTGD